MMISSFMNPAIMLVCLDSLDVLDVAIFFLSTNETISLQNKRKKRGGGGREATTWAACYMIVPMVWWGFELVGGHNLWFENHDDWFIDGFEICCIHLLRPCVGLILFIRIKSH